MGEEAIGMNKTKGGRGVFITKTPLHFLFIPDVGLTLLPKNQQISTLAKFHTILSQIQPSVVSSNSNF